MSPREKLSFSRLVKFTTPNCSAKSEHDSLTAPNFVPPGHFYSPLPSREDAERAIVRTRLDSRNNLPGISIDDNAMLAMWQRLAPLGSDMPFADAAGAGPFRYHYHNDMYSYGDAAIYFALIRLLQPRRIIEIGSGYSSALALDAKDILSLPIQLTFIEPHPARLFSLLRESDRSSTRIVTDVVQNVSLDLFDELDESDILFIDSSHVAKAGSDVCFEIFEILPRLKSGVYVHFHDCFWPFEYPQRWVVEENRAWNELYFIRAFLMHNAEWKIEFFNSYFAVAFRPDAVKFPHNPFLKNPGGGLWLRRT